MKLKITQALVAIALSLLPAAAGAQSYTIAPTPFQTALDNSGHIITNACIWTYQAGTTTLATTYTDTAGTANLNPIRSDGAGRFTVYLVAGSSYKFVYESSCTPPAHGTTLRTADPVTGTPSSSVNLDVTGTAGETLTAGQAVYLSDGSGSKTAGQWYKADSANGYSSSTAIAVGLVPSSVTSGNAGTIRLGGVVPGLSVVVGSTYYIGTSGALTLTPPTNRRTLGIADTTTSLVIVLSGPLQQGYILTTTTGTVNNWVPGTGLNSSGSTLVQFNGSSDLIVTGLAGGAVNGQLVTFYNATGFVVYFVNQSGSSLAANQFFNNATTGNTPIATGGSVTYQFNQTAWVMVQHEQGSWITPTFAAGNFTSASTWGVIAGNVSVCRWKLRGKEVWLQITLADATTLGATPGSNLFINKAVYGGFTWNTSAIATRLGRANDSGTLREANFVTNGGTNLIVQREDAVAWTAGATFGLSGLMIGEVQ